MAITRLLLLIVALVAHRYGATPPNVRPPAEQLRKQCGAERFVHRIVIVNRILLGFWFLVEAPILLAYSEFCPPALAEPLLRHLPSTITSDLAAHTAPMPIFVAGTLLALGGALLRAHCFRTLGQRFTFELSIRPTHVLVTDGVYGIVRHPSYTGVVALVVGYLLCVLDPRGLVVSACVGALVPGFSGSTVVMAVLACMWATALGVLYIGLSKRMSMEDAMLEETFGETWLTWAKRVPNWLVPGVY